MNNHISDAITTVSTIQRIKEVPLPEQTSSYSPVPHMAVIEMTKEALDKEGIQLISERYSLARDGRQMSAGFVIGEGDGEMKQFIKFQNSYDKTIPLGWAIGANVIVCTNGMVRGDAGQFKRKHTGSILEEYAEAIKTYIGGIGDMFNQLVEDRERMKNITLNKRNFAELIGRLYIQEGIITNTQLNVIKREIEMPTFEYLADDTLWQLYNHTTFALKDDHPNQGIKRLQQVHDFFTNEFKIC